jgi:hypothetical protein
MRCASGLDTLLAEDLRALIDGLDNRTALGARDAGLVGAGLGRRAASK